MSGAGSSPAGSSPAGYDPVGAPSTQLITVPSDSVQYDPTVKDFGGTTGGYWAAVHPVDQETTLALTIERGKLKSAPDVGATYREIKRIGPSIQADVEDRTREALRRLLASPPRIALIGVETDTRVRGHLLIAVSYQNLVTLERKIVRTSINLSST